MKCSDVSSGNKYRQIPGVEFTMFYLSVLFFVSYVVLCSVSVCVLYVFSNGSIIPPPMRWVCLFSHRELLYLCVLFFIFLYGYLLHYVVYNTVVCINTIIYFSMEKKESKANNCKPGKIRLRHTEVCFSNKWKMFFFEKKQETRTLQAWKLEPVTSLHPFSC